jgi:hypothetical protein
MLPLVYARAVLVEQLSKEPPRASLSRWAELLEDVERFTIERDVDSHTISAPAALWLLRGGHLRHAFTLLLAHNRAALEPNVSFSCVSVL